LGFERVSLLVLAVLVVAAPRGGAAQPGGDGGDASASLELDAPPECATRKNLIARVGTRSHHIRFLAPAATASALRVVVAQSARGAVTGELTLVRPDGRRASRRLAAPTCAEIVDGLALIIAITLDPAHAITDPAVTAAGDADAPPASSSLPAAASASTPAAAPTPEPSPPAATAEPPPPEMVSTAAPAPTHRWAAVGAGGRLVVGPAPEVMPGIALHGMVAFDRPSLWSPAARLALARTAVGGLLQTGGTADFALDAGTMDACPFRLALPPLDLRACAAATLGRLTVQGTNTYSGRSAYRPFVAVGGSALAALGLGQRFEVGVRVAGAAPLIRDAFQFVPQVFYRVASVTLEVDLSLAMRFP
jgi:hypothetical protein